jgi:spermidine/putrescine transport system ATP-binding protein
LFPHLSVQDNVGFGLRMKHVPRDEARSRIAEAIEMVQLKGMEHRRPNQLSGGQQQRVALARALVCRPKVLLLDEPMAALDAALRRNMQVELKNLQQRLGITFLFVTHDQGEALLLSDRIAVMNGGAVEQFDTAVQVYTKPATPFVARFIGQANVMEASAISSDGSTTRLRTNGGTELTAAGLHRGEVCLAIRSESIRIQDSPINGANVLHAKVQQVLFGGATAQYSLQTDGGMLLTASAPPSAIRAGDTVWCEIDPQSILVLSG